MIQAKAGLCGIKRGTAQCYTAGRAQRSMCFTPQKPAYDFSKQNSEEIALIRQDQLSTFPLLFAYTQYKEQKRVFRLRRFYLFRESIFPVGGQLKRHANIAQKHISVPGNQFPTGTHYSGHVTYSRKNIYPILRDTFTNLG